MVIYKDPATSDIQTGLFRARSGSRKARSSTSTRRWNDQSKVDRILRSKSSGPSRGREPDEEDDELAEAIRSSQSSALDTQSTILADQDLNGSRKRTAEQARIGQDKTPQGVESRPVRIPRTGSRALTISND